MRRRGGGVMIIDMFTPYILISWKGGSYMNLSWIFLVSCSWNKIVGNTGMRGETCRPSDGGLLTVDIGCSERRLIGHPFYRRKFLRKSCATCREKCRRAAPLTEKSDKPAQWTPGINCLSRVESSIRMPGTRPIVGGDVSYTHSNDTWRVTKKAQYGIAYRTQSVTKKGTLSQRRALFFPRKTLASRVPVPSRAWTFLCVFHLRQLSYPTPYIYETRERDFHDCKIRTK
jgi:hypothetical protein